MKSYLSLIFATFFAFGCSFKSVMVERIKAPQFNLGAGKKLALAEVTGPWQAQSNFKAELQRQIIKQGYFKLVYFSEGTSSRSNEIHIIFDTKETKLSPQAKAMTKKAGADYLIRIQTLDWDTDRKFGEDLVEEKVWDDISQQYMKKKVRKPWVLKKYRVAAAFDLIDVTNDEVILYETFSETYDKKFYEDIYSTNYSYLENLTEKIVSDFLHLITPYYTQVEIEFDIAEDKLDKPAISACKKKRYDEALAHWFNLTKTHPKRSASFYNIGVVYHVQGKIDLAQQFYKKAISIESKPLYQKSLGEIEDSLRDQKKLRTKSPVKTKDTTETLPTYND